MLKMVKYIICIDAEQWIYIVELTTSILWLLIPQTIQCKINTLCYKCHMHCSILSLWLSSNLQILPYSPLCFWYSLPPDSLPNFPLLVPSPFLSSDPLHGIKFPWNWKKSSLGSFRSNLKTFFSPKYRPSMFSTQCCYLPLLQVPSLYLRTFENFNIKVELLLDVQSLMKRVNSSGESTHPWDALVLSVRGSDS